MRDDTRATLLGLAWAVCFLAVCFVLSAGPKLTGELLLDLVDSVRAAVRVVLPWP